MAIVLYHYNRHYIDTVIEKSIAMLRKYALILNNTPNRLTSNKLVPLLPIVRYWCPASRLKKSMPSMAIIYGLG